MTEFEKLISKYTDADQYYKTVGFYHVAVRIWEMETRKIIDAIVEREGYGADLQNDGDRITNTRKTYFTEDRKKIAYAIPRRYYSQTDGNLEVTKVEVIWLSYRYEDDEHRYPTEENETVIPITEDDERRLMDLTRQYENARKDYEAVRRTAVINLFNAYGIKTGEFKKKIQALQDLVNGLFEAVTMQDAENLQEIRYKQILALEGINDDTRNELIREFCTKHYEADNEADKVKQLACVYANFANCMITEIPDGFISEQFSIYQGKKDRTAEEEERYLLLREVNSNNGKRAFELADKWFYEVGGDYVKSEEEKPAEDETETLQRFAESEAVIQDYTSPTQQIYGLTKAQRIIFDDEGLADEITTLENGQLQYIFAVSKADAKTQRAVILDIADKVKGLTKFDKSVLNAVFSEIEAGNTTFTSKQVAIQNTQNSKPRPNAVGAYTKSIDKMRTIVHKINATEHLEMNGYNLEEMGIKKVEKEGYLLPVEGTIITMNNGEKVKGYQLIKRPVLLDYAKDTKQILTVDNKVLDIPVNKSETILIMRDYLIQQIGIIYNPNSRISNNILISTVLDYAGFDLLTMDRRKKSDQIKHIKTMIEYWHKIKYIEYGYKFNYKGKSLESITIYPRPKAKKK